jgi:hypothetical protein
LAIWPDANQACSSSQQWHTSCLSISEQREVKQDIIVKVKDTHASFTPPPPSLQLQEKNCYGIKFTTIEYQKIIKYWHGVNVSMVQAAIKMPGEGWFMWKSTPNCHTEVDFEFLLLKNQYKTVTQANELQHAQSSHRITRILVIDSLHFKRN